jgi:predicted nuclease of predicted toxin-antitoxin system
MKFLIDAQLPVRLARFLQTAGYDVIHTKDLPQQNSTSDNQINEISLQQKRIVISKDSDFVNSFLTMQKPYKLLLITTGNISNSELEAIFVNQLSRLVNLFEIHQYIELSRDSIIVHH